MIIDRIVRSLSTMSNTYIEGFHSVAYVTISSKEEAETLAGKIVEQNHAACVNIIPSVTSVYKWKEKIEKDTEFLLMIKTRTSKIDELSKFVVENHPYDTPEVISTAITNGNPGYLQWISDSVPVPKDK